MENTFFNTLLSQIPEDIKNYTSLSMGIAAYIDDILKERGWSQKVLADKLKKRESEISKWLSCDHNFTLSSISKIEEALDTQLVIIPRYRPCEINTDTHNSINNSNDHINELSSDQISTKLIFAMPSRESNGHNSFFEDALEQIPDNLKFLTEMSMGIAAYIDDILDERKWSQKILADKLNKRESEVSKWLSCDHNFTLSTISKIEEVLGIQLIHIPVYRMNTNIEMATYSN